MKEGSRKILVKAGGGESEKGDSWDGYREASPTFQRSSVLISPPSGPGTAPEFQSSWAPDTSSTCTNGGRFSPETERDRERERTHTHTHVCTGALPTLCPGTTRLEVSSLPECCNAHPALHPMPCCWEISRLLVSKLMALINQMLTSLIYRLLN